ncbi:hypothetical protein BV898_03259 [Hypsibius exemplaris]|uniref:Uncharacterized protein n=1 Tax=Hypsibius exemplaris TaxID=2072580 RepID=A0A1W0X5Q8_HYPEX|nr:hypothetical protein BV898_03259 [Hypsibius exemplaris]
MSSLFYFAILAGVISTGRAAIQTTSVSGFYRIEVQLGHLENTLGYQANGQFCDEMTACDPVIYTSIDVEKPLAPWPTKTPTDQIMLTWRRNTNSYEINQTIYKDICGGGLSNVNARIEVMDEDFLGKYDLIEQFECKFFPPIADTTATGDSLQELSYREFTPLSECQAKHQPTKLRLFFRWRVYPIDMAECGTDPKPIANVVLVDRQTLAP